MTPLLESVLAKVTDDLDARRELSDVAYAGSFRSQEQQLYVQWTRVR
jgi:hypothetical protein